MNGRVYDARIARFQSGDPLVQQPTSTQNYNRYSYVLNNPLNATDPSGFEVYGLFSPSQGTMFMYDRSSGDYAYSDSWFTGIQGYTVNRPLGPLPFGSYRILERSGTMAGATAYRLEAIDGYFGDDRRDGKRGEFRLHRGSVSHGCVTCGSPDNYEKFNRLLQMTETSTSEVEYIGGARGFFASKLREYTDVHFKESLEDFGKLDVLRDELSLNFDQETGYVSIQGSYSLPGSPHKIDIDRHVCTVGSAGACE